MTQDEFTITKQASPVAVVILNYNKAQATIECIKHFIAQEYKESTIIVVDNGSSDNSCRIIKTMYPEVHLIANSKNLGVAGGRNTGIRYISECLKDIEFIMFSDNDIIVRENAITEMAEVLDQNSEIGIVTPKLLRMNGLIEYAGGIDVNLMTGRLVNIGNGEEDYGQYNRNSEDIDSAGGIFMIRAELLKKCGGFDEKFNPYGWEDVDLSLRVRKRGYKIRYNHNAVFYHKGGKSVRGFNRIYEISKFRNYFYLVNKHLNTLQLLVCYLILPIRMIYLLLTNLRQSFKLPHLKKLSLTGRIR